MKAPAIALASSRVPPVAVTWTAWVPGRVMIATRDSRALGPMSAVRLRPASRSGSRVTRTFRLGAAMDAPKRSMPELGNTTMAIA